MKKEREEFQLYEKILIEIGHASDQLDRRMMIRIIFPHLFSILGRIYTFICVIYE